MFFSSDGKNSDMSIIISMLWHQKSMTSWWTRFRNFTFVQCALIVNNIVFFLCINSNISIKRRCKTISSWQIRTWNLTRSSLTHWQIYHSFQAKIVPIGLCSQWHAGVFLYLAHGTLTSSETTIVYFIEVTKLIFVRTYFPFANFGHIKMI